VKLQDLLARVPGTRLSGDPATEVTSVTHDSRQAGPGALFVAIKGATADGNTFVEAALKKGAAAVASEDAARGGAAWLQVPHARQALASLSAAVLGDPTRHLTLVGVTGTNGKTTTTYLVDAILRAAGHTVGLLGTVQYRLGSRLSAAVRTTPEASDLQVLFAEMVQAGCTHAVLEVSSHSLQLDRVHDVPFRVAAFTNLTRDHLDFHGDMDAYFAAKRILFERNLDPGGRAVINADDERAPELAEASRAPVWTYGIDRPADFRAHDIVLGLEGTSFTVDSPLGPLAVKTPLLGRFNVHNICAALASTLALGVAPELALQGVAKVTGVPGRLERVEAGQPFTVIVDYAHTDDALKKVLDTVRELQPRRLITVFGCGGDRDRTKRPLMGLVASRLSDIVIVTSDNPRSEPPEAIIEEILRGMNGGRKAERHEIVDRRDAIVRALQIAGPGDAVVIAGKGHETYQVLRDRTVPFDDRQVAREAIARLTGPAAGEAM
jgi:UDP-N-acetylmuramoyl-L-alanyl-D-glutamate--2,6-diaminopimelate ligase